MEPSKRTLSGGYANNPPPGMGHRGGGGTPHEWSLSTQMGLGEDWARGSPHSGPQNNVEQWGVGAVGEGRPPSMSSYSWSLSNERGDPVGLSSSPHHHVNGSLDNMDSYRGIDASTFSTSFPAIFDKCKTAEIYSFFLLLLYFLFVWVCFVGISGDFECLNCATQPTCSSYLCIWSACRPKTAIG